MVSNLATLLMAGIAVAVLVFAGCTAPAPGSALPPAATATPAPFATPPTPMNAMQCSSPADCVPAQSCHPTSCINKVARPSGDAVVCTAMCSGPLDCGAGSCGCVQGTCTVIPAGNEAAAGKPSVRLEAAPQRYSPMMSSTPGIGLTVNTTGITPSATNFTWTTSYGQFLKWDAPDYTVRQQGTPVTNHGEKLYWSFIEKPATTTQPVTITVVAKDSATGDEVGKSTVTLAWDGDFAVTVRGIS